MYISQNKLLCLQCIRRIHVFNISQKNQHFKIYIYLTCAPKNHIITKSKKNQFFGNVDITNNMFEVLEMENRAVENRKAQKEEEIA